MGNFMVCIFYHNKKRKEGRKEKGKVLFNYWTQL